MYSGRLSNSYLNKFDILNLMSILSHAKKSSSFQAKKNTWIGSNRYTVGFGQFKPVGIT